MESLLGERAAASPPASPAPFPADLLENIRCLRQELSLQTWFRINVAPRLDWSYSILVVPLVDATASPWNQLSSEISQSYAAWMTSLAKMMLIGEEILIPTKGSSAQRVSFFANPLISRESTDYAQSDCATQQVLAKECREYFRWLLDRTDEWNLDTIRLELRMVLDYVSSRTVDFVPVTKFGMDDLSERCLAPPMDLDDVSYNTPHGVLTPAATIQDPLEQTDSNPLSVLVETLVVERLLTAKLTREHSGRLWKEWTHPFAMR